MQLSDVLEPDCVIVPLEADSKQAAIFALADVLAGHAGIEDAHELKNAIWQREQIRTTGIGHGIAIPHGKLKVCDRLVMAVGRLATPIEFGAIDGKPVDLIFLLASPVDQTGPHIQALASISRMLTQDHLRHGMKEAQTGQDLFDLIISQDSKQPAG